MISLTSDNLQKLNVTDRWKLLGECISAQYRRKDNEEQKITVAMFTRDYLLNNVKEEW